MPSSSDYTLAKKILNIQKNMNLITDFDSNNCYNCNSTVIGNDCTTSGQQGPQGPPGPPGDRYLTTFTDTLHKYVMDTGSIGIQLENGLAYIHGLHIRCVHDALSSPYDNFTGTVMSYNDKTGVMIINNINNISAGFVYSTERTYKINIDNYYENLDENTQSSTTVSISKDNTTNTRCYINFVKTENGDLTSINTSDKITFSPSNGELSINSIRETTNNQTRVNITPLDASYSTTFITSLSPKKYSMSTQPTLERFGFLAEDISSVYDNIGMANNNSICYSEIIAPIVSVLKNVLNKLDAIDERISKLEIDLSGLSISIPPAPVVLAASAYSEISPTVATDAASVTIDPPLDSVPAPYLSQERNNFSTENYSEDVNINKFVQMIAEAKKKVMNSYI